MEDSQEFIEKNKEGNEEESFLVYFCCYCGVFFVLIQVFGFVFRIGQFTLLSFKLVFFLGDFFLVFYFLYKKLKRVRQGRKEMSLGFDIWCIFENIL